MRNKLLTQVRSLQFVADWLDLREAKRDDRKLKAKYEADVKARPDDEREFIWSEYRDEFDIIWAPIYVRRSNKLVARARKYGVRVPPPPRDSSGDDNWDWSGAGMDWILTDEAKERLNSAITVEKRQSDDEVRKSATLIVSIGAFILALLSLIVSFKHRPPDPCPKNYYRNDHGESAFSPCGKNLLHNRNKALHSHLRCNRKSPPPRTQNPDAGHSWLDAGRRIHGDGDVTAGLRARCFRPTGDPVPPFRFL